MTGFAELMRSVSARKPQDAEGMSPDAALEAIGGAVKQAPENKLRAKPAGTGGARG